MENINKLLIICGPTGSGKTALAINLAKRLNTEVISADSMCIYKGLDVGTAKPTSKERAEVVHQMIDVADTKSEFSVSDYEAGALFHVNRLLNEGKTPIICGGTGFYINSLIYKLSYGNSSANLDARNKYLNMAKDKGNAAVFDILMQVDPETAEKLHANDIKRVVRALEIYESTGTPKSQIKDDYVKRFDYKAYSYNYPREELYSRINARVDLMFKNGLVDEVKGLIKLGISIKNQCMQGIGYKEVYEYLIGNLSLEDAIELIKLNTRRYAKRQITFFKRYDNLKYLEPNDINFTTDLILKDLQE